MTHVLTVLALASVALAGCDTTEADPDYSASRDITNRGMCIKGGPIRQGITSRVIRRGSIRQVSIRQVSIRRGVMGVIIHTTGRATGSMKTSASRNSGAVR